jgi:signal transduction histidine kinase
MLGEAMAQDAKVEVERSMTAYFAHELRNPLSAIDSALQTLPLLSMPCESQRVVASMQICSSFMVRQCVQHSRFAVCPIEYRLSPPLERSF